MFLLRLHKLNLLPRLSHNPNIHNIFFSMLYQTLAPAAVVACPYRVADALRISYTRFAQTSGGTFTLYTYLFVRIRHAKTEEYSRQIKIVTQYQQINAHFLNIIGTGTIITDLTR